MPKPRAKQLGVTDADYQRMLAAQGGGCAICGAEPKTRRLHVDHDHKTGNVRGLLCYRCNRALPNYVTRKWLLQAAFYMRERDPETERLTTAWRAAMDQAARQYPK